MTSQAVETKPPVSAEEFQTVLEELAELRAKVDSKPVYGVLPPQAIIGDDGLLYHEVTRILEGGSSMLQRRRLASSLEEARTKRLDYYHPKLGLIWEGFKLASDRDAQDVIDDKTNTTIRKDS